MGFLTVQALIKPQRYPAMHKTSTSNMSGKEIRKDGHLVSESGVSLQIAVVTRVVDTMVHAPRPTRAEATDVANLVLDGADCILLGAETFRGLKPVLAAETVRDICRQAETVYDAEGFYYKLMDDNGGFRGSNLSAVRFCVSNPALPSSFLAALSEAIS